MADDLNAGWDAFDKGQIRSCYICGPMTDIEQFNFPAFLNADEDLSYLGWDTANPAKHDLETGFDPALNSLDGFNPETAMRWDLEQIFTRDCVIVLPGWEMSSGAAIETRLAWFLKKPVYAYPSLDLVMPSSELDRIAFERQAFPEQWIVQDTDGNRKLVTADPAEDKVSDLETRTISPTGGEKGTKPEALGAIDPLALRYLARVGAVGEAKYARFNFLKGYKWSLSVDALFRHLLAFLDGEDTDPESGLPHTAHVAWHGLCLTSFLTRDLGEDDRYKKDETDNG